MCIKALCKVKDHFRNMDPIIDIAIDYRVVKLAIASKFIVSKVSKVVMVINILDHNRDLIPIFIKQKVSFFMEGIIQITVVIGIHINFGTNYFSYFNCFGYFNFDNKDLKDSSNFIISVPYFLIEILHHLLYFSAIKFFQISYLIE